jgi:allantoin racemase
LKRILLINPNTNRATTDMMVAIAQEAAGADVEIVGATAARGPAMIVEPEALAASAIEVVKIAVAAHGGYDGLIVAAFGDPGLSEVRARCTVPAVGIAESAMLEASVGGRRFGIATTTPRLADQIGTRVTALSLDSLYAGIRLTSGDPDTLVADPQRLTAALAEAARLSIGQDGAEAVVIGGGPLGQAARQLQPCFSVPIIAPIPAAVRHLWSERAFR